MKVAIISSFYASSVLPDEEINKLGLAHNCHPFPWISNLATGLAKLGVNVHVVTMSNEFNRDYNVKKDNVVYNFLKPAGKITRGLTLFESDKRRIHKFLKEEGFDIVHGQGLNIFGYFAVTSDIPHVITIHLYMTVIDMIKDINKFNFLSLYYLLLSIKYKRAIFKNEKNFISISPFVHKVLEQKGIKAKMYDVENPVHSGYFSRGDLAVEDFCLYVGSITERKNVLDLVKALNLSKSLKLKIISQTIAGQYFLKVKEYVVSNNLSQRVEFLGSKTNNDIIDTLKRSRFLVLPSKKEMAPVVISEAMAAGKPVIATAVEGVPYMIHDKETGFLVPPSDIQKLIKKMELLYSDSSLQRKMGMKARQEALRRWHPDVVAERTLEVYRHILPDQKKRR